jgi:hypothetical protein
LRSANQPSELGTRLGQLPRVLNKSWCRASFGPPHRPLLNSQVPHVPRVPTLHLQPSSLRRRGIQPIPRHASDPISYRRQFGDRLEGRRRDE